MSPTRPLLAPYHRARPVTYLYHRTDTDRPIISVAYIPHDVRPEAEAEEHERDPQVVVGGDKGYVVQLFRENDYVHDHGLATADELYEQVFNPA